MNRNIVTVLNEVSRAPKGQPIEEVLVSLFRALISLADGGAEVLGAARYFQLAMQSLYEENRNVRESHKLLIEGAQRFLDGQALLDDWKRRIEEILADHPTPSPESHSGNGQMLPE